MDLESLVSIELGLMSLGVDGLAFYAVIVLCFAIDDFRRVPVNAWRGSISCGVQT